MTYFYRSPQIEIPRPGRVVNPLRRSLSKDAPQFGRTSSPQPSTISTRIFSQPTSFPSATSLPPPQYSFVSTSSPAKKNQQGTAGSISSPPVFSQQPTVTVTGTIATAQVGTTGAPRPTPYMLSVTNLGRESALTSSPSLIKRPNHC